MKPQRMNPPSLMTLALIALAALCVESTSRAQLIAHEPFEGELKAGAGMQDYSGGEGFAGRWSASDGVEVQAAEGLALGRFPASGQAMLVARTGEINAKRYAFRPLKNTRLDEELWISYLARWTKDNGGKGHSAELGVGTSAHQDDSAMVVHTRVLSINDENKFGIGYSEQASASTPKSNTADKTVLVVARWSGIGHDDQSAMVWVFDSEAAVDKVLAARDVSALNDHSYTQERVEGFLAGWGDGLGIKVGGFIGGDPGAYEIVIDELRVGHQAKDVLPGAKIAAAPVEAVVVHAQVLTALPTGERTIYVATDGDDASADPTNPQTPLRTISKAAQIVQAGETVVIRGGTYRESVRIERVGTADHPITFKPHEGETVMVSGLEPVRGEWTKVEGDKPIWSVALTDRFESKQTQSDQVFVDGRMVDVARHPNFSEHGDRMQPGNWFTVDHFVGSHGISGETEWGPIRKGPSERATIIAEDIEAPDGTWDDAQVWIKPEEHGVSWGFGWACPVIEHKGKRLTFDMAGEVSEFNKIAPGIRFFLYDAQNLLDAPGEWWLDREANRLYVWLPGDANPNDHTIEVKRRDWAFDLTDSAYVTLKDIHVFGATITTDNEYSDGRGGGGWITNNRDSDNPDVAMGNARAHHITLDGIRATHVSHFMGTWGFMHGQWTNASGIQLVGEDHVMRNCLVAHSAGNGVSVFGYRHQLVNNVIHDVAYSGAHASGIFFQHGTQTPILPTDYEVANNTLYRAGWGLIDCSNLYSSDPANPSRIHHNFIDAPGLISKDVGGIRFVGHTKPPHEVNGTRVDHNFVRGCVAALGNAIYFDFNNNYQADHNIVAHSINLMNINDAHDMLIAHNTGHTLQGGIGGNPKRTKFRNVRVVNNLTNRGVPDRMGRLDPTYQQSHNIVTEDLGPLVADLPANNFHLAEGSKAIDGGAPIEGLAHPTVGAAPDVGALEHGVDDWTNTIGADWVHEPAPTELKVQPRPDGSVELSWKDNAEGEEGFVVERGYKTDHPNGGWEYIIVAHTGPNQTNARDHIEGAYQTYFYRVRTTRSYYSTEVVLRAGLAAASRIGFEQSGGYEPGDLIEQTSWLGVHSGQGAGKAHPEGFNVVDLNGNRVLKITGDGRAAALGSMNMIAPEFEPGTSKVRFAVKLGIVNPVANTDDNAIDIKIGGLDHWRSPGNVLCSVVVGRDGTLKWGWKPLAKLTDHTSDDKPLVEVIGVIDTGTGKVESLTIGGQSIDTKDLTATQGAQMAHALWQINAGTGGDTAVLVDDLTLEVVD